MGITPQQEHHREQIIQDFGDSYRPIYTRGAKEYQTKMYELPVFMMVQEGMNENQDGYAYGHVAKSQLEKVRTRLTALKEQIQETVDASIKGEDTPVFIIEKLYDPIRRIEAIERLLYGEG